MELTIQLEDNADISFLKKMLSQIKAIKSIEVSEQEETYSWEEIENSEYFGKVMDQSREQIKKGEYIEHSEELINSIFGKK